MTKLEGVNLNKSLLIRSKSINTEMGKCCPIVFLIELIEASDFGKVLSITSNLVINGLLTFKALLALSKNIWPLNVASATSLLPLLVTLIRALMATD